MASVFPDSFNGTPFTQLMTQGVLVVVFALDDWHGYVADAFTIIDEPERERVQRQRQQGHRDSRALAYALHRLVLARTMGVSAAEVPLTRDARGCPVLADSGIETSLSHTDGYVAVAVSAHGPVGVDIEPTDRASTMPEIAERVCHEDEYGRIASAGDASTGAALLELWVRKEAFLKAARVGLAREMDTFALPDGEAHLLHPGHPGRVVVDLLDLGPAVACAVARPPESGHAAGWLRPVRAAG